MSKYKEGKLVPTIAVLTMASMLGIACASKFFVDVIAAKVNGENGAVNLGFVAAAVSLSSSREQTIGVNFLRDYYL